MTHRWAMCIMDENLCVKKAKQQLTDPEPYVHK